MSIDLSKLSFDELREELYKCNNDPIKELIIRKIMRNIYINHLKKNKLIKQQKQFLIKQKREQKRQIMKKKIMKRYKQESNKLVNELIDEMDKENDDTKIYKQNYLYNRKMGYKKNIKQDSKNDVYKKEINNNVLNNNLMSRMDGEIFIRKNKRNMEKSFIPPYTNDIGAIYAPFNKQKQIIKNFTTKSFK